MMKRHLVKFSLAFQAEAMESLVVNTVKETIFDLLTLTASFLGFKQLQFKSVLHILSSFN